MSHLETAIIGSRPYGLSLAAHLRPHPRVREGMWLAAAGGVSVVIRDPGCVGKTFPTFFEVLASVSGT